MKRATLLLALVAFLGAALAPRRTRADDASSSFPEPVIQWGVQKGESCEDIARAVYGSVKHRNLVTRYNRVQCTRGAPLKEGMTLVLPAKVTEVPTARIRALDPSVRAKPAGGAWASAASGQPLDQGANVATAEKARADIQFIDRTRIFMAENTLVVIFGTASQTSVSKAPPPLVEIEEGEVKAALAALGGTAPPTVEIAAKGGGRVSAASRDTVVNRKGERTTIQVFQGNAKVENAKRTVDVPENHGTRFEGARAPEPARPLPPAPTFRDGLVRDIVMAPKGALGFQVAWTEVARARAYRIEVARDAAFETPILRAEVPKETLSFRAEKVASGSYFVRVRAIDTEDFLGIATAAREVTVAEAALGSGSQVLIDRTQEGAGASEAVRQVNPYDVLELSTPPTVEVALDDGPFAPAPPRIDLLRVRPKTLRLRIRGRTEERTVQLVYLDVRARLSPAGASDATLTLAVTLGPAEGASLLTRIGPSLRITRRDGKVERMPLATGTGGATWNVTIPDRATVAQVEVVDARDRVLGATTVDAASPVAAPDARPAPRAEMGMSFEPWATNVYAPSFFSPAPRDAITFGGGVGATFGDGAALEVPYAVGRISGQGTLWPLTFEGSIAAGRTTTDDDRPTHADDGAVLGVRAHLAPDERSLLQLGPAVRVRIPVHELGSPLRLEGGFALGAQLDELGLFGSVGTRIRLEDHVADTGTLPAFGAFTITYDPVTVLRLLAEIDVGAAYDARRALPAGPFGDSRIEPADLVTTGGVSIGAEVGTIVFASAVFRAAPLPGPVGGLSGVLAVGLRTESTHEAP